MSTDLQSIASEIQGKQKAALAAYRELTREAASDESSLDATEVESVLRAAEKTVDELHTDVHVCRRRNERRKTIAAAKNAKDKIDEANRAIESENEKLAAAKEARDAVVMPLLHEITGARDSISAAYEAKRELRDTMWPEDREQFDQLEFWCKKAHSELEQSRTALAAIKSRFARNQPQINMDRWLSESEINAERRERQARIRAEQPEAAAKALQAVTNAEQNLADRMAERDAFLAEAMER
tara:strand:- start:52803 stop:53525 length:723 start_codon:yes stop_codon:yes gene_type:complete